MTPLDSVKLRLLPQMIVLMFTGSGLVAGCNDAGICSRSRVNATIRVIIAMTTVYLQCGGHNVTVATRVNGPFNLESTTYNFTNQR